LKSHNKNKKFHSFFFNLSIFFSKFLKAFLFCQIFIRTFSDEVDISFKVSNQPFLRAKAVRDFFFPKNLSEFKNSKMTKKIEKIFILEICFSLRLILFSKKKK